MALGHGLASAGPLLLNVRVPLPRPLLCSGARFLGGDALLLLLGGCSLPCSLAAQEPRVQTSTNE